MSLHSSSSINGEGSTPNNPLYKILDGLRSLKLWKEKQKRKEKGKKEWKKYVTNQNSTQEAKNRNTLRQTKEFKDK